MCVTPPSAIGLVVRTFLGVRSEFGWRGRRIILAEDVSRVKPRHLPISREFEPSAELEAKFLGDLL